MLLPEAREVKGYSYMYILVCDRIVSDYTNEWFIKRIN